MTISRSRDGLPPGLVVDGAPPISESVVGALRPYQSVRPAQFFDFLPDGSMLAGTRFGETTQVHRVASPGADRQQVTFESDPIGLVRCDASSAEPGFILAMDRSGDERFQLYWQELGSRPRLLTDGTSRHTSLVLAPEGGRAAFTSTARNGIDHDIHLVGLRDGSQPTCVAEVSGAWRVEDWSPDGATLLLQHFVSANESTLHLLDLASRELSPLHPPRASGEATVARRASMFEPGGRGVLYLSDEGCEFSRLRRRDLASGSEAILAGGDADIDAYDVSTDGRWLAFEVNASGRSQLHVGPADDPKRCRPVDLPSGVISDLHFADTGDRLGLTLSSCRSAGDAWSVDVSSLRVTRWTHGETGGLDPSRFVEPELVSHPSFDGRPTPAWLYVPASARAGAPVPVVVDIHGGPEAQARPSWNGMAQFLASERGVAVMLPNVRGSSGYGKSALLLDNGMKREDSVRDIGAMLDFIAADPRLDASRVAAVGGSYGGYMALASMVHHGPRLRCGASSVGIGNFVTFLENTQAHRRDLRRVEYGDEREPAMRAFLESISPVRHAGRMKRPLLVTQGANDPRVPASEAEQIVAAARAAGVDVWYVLATDEGHGFKRRGNRDAQQALLVMFLEQHL